MRRWFDLMWSHFIREGADNFMKTYRKPAWQGESVHNILIYAWRHLWTTLIATVIIKTRNLIQVSIMTHCNERGSEMFVGDKAHIFLYEQGGASYVSIIHSNCQEFTFKWCKTFLGHNIRSSKSSHQWWRELIFNLKCFSIAKTEL